MPSKHETDTNDTSKISPTYVKSIFVEDLFGTYTYRIDLNLRADEHPPLIILYGDNGTGKTTILRLLYSALSDAPGRGLKTQIALTPFRIFEITFDDNTRVRYRKDDGLSGPYTVTFYYADKTEIVIPVKMTNDDRITIETPGAKDLLNELSLLNIYYYFLSDDRFFQASTFSDDEEAEDDLFANRRLGIRDGPGGMAEFRDEIRVLEINQAIKRINTWYRHKTLQGSNIGEENANTLLLNVLKHISTHAAVSQKETGNETDTKRIQDLGARNETFYKYGLRPALPATEITDIIRETPPAAIPLLSNVLQAFLDGFEARLDAIQEVRDLIQLFLDTINTYFSNKFATYSLHRGLQIQTPKEQPLLPQYLSSGEKQLLLLLCNALIARDYKSIFIIDEPELSLNVKWQRQLIGSLMKCAGTTSTQFIIATHSLELLSQHRSAVVQLSPTPESLDYELDS